MRLALEQAALAGARGEVPVGAVVLGPSGEVLAVAGNDREAGGDPTAHAEVLALRAAARERGEWR
ncbi:deaminase, partial [Sphaerisporangium melleum]